MRKGFTLIELMVVIAVIGILAAIALVSLTGIQKNARDSQRKSNLSDYATALARVYQDTQSYYGSTSTSTGDLASTPSGLFANVNYIGTGKYIATVLKDPQTTAVCYIGATSGSACDYYYLGTASDFVLWTHLEAPAGTASVYYIRDNGNRKAQSTDCAAASIAAAEVACP